MCVGLDNSGGSVSSATEAGKEAGDDWAEDGDNGDNQLRQRRRRRRRRRGSSLSREEDCVVGWGIDKYFFGKRKQIIPFRTSHPFHTCLLCHAPRSPASRADTLELDWAYPSPRACCHPGSSPPPFARHARPPTPYPRIRRFHPPSNRSRSRSHSPLPIVNCRISRTQRADCRCALCQNSAENSPRGVQEDRRRLTTPWPALIASSDIRVANAAAHTAYGWFSQPYRCRSALLWPAAIDYSGPERLRAANGCRSILNGPGGRIIAVFRAAGVGFLPRPTDGQDVLKASPGRQAFSFNTPSMLPFLLRSVAPRGLWTIHRRVGVRHGRGPRAACTDQVELVYISTRGSNYTYLVIYHLYIFPSPCAAPSKASIPSAYQEFRTSQTSFIKGIRFFFFVSSSCVYSTLQISHRAAPSVRDT